MSLCHPRESGNDRRICLKGENMLRPIISLLALFTIILGGIYPLMVTVVGQMLFPHQSEGSLIEKDGKILGSELIGQNFTDPKYFWGRLSATAPAYNAAASSGSNLGSANPNLEAAVKARLEALGATADKPVPVDLVTASGSGLDPHISPAAAEYQVARVAKARGKSEGDIRTLVEQYTAGRQLGFLGEPRVNVLKLNLALEGKL